MQEKVLLPGRLAEARAMIRQNMREMDCSETTSQPAQIKPIFRLPPERARPVEYEQVYKPIDVARANEYVGKSVAVTRNNGRRQECRLVGIDGSKLVFEHRIGSGKMTFSYDDYDITALEALTNVPVI